jgi:hypothetical protein
VLRANASHAELLAAAGPGKYRLEAVDEHWHKIDGVPVACTGPLSADEDPGDDDTGVEIIGAGTVRPVSYESVLCHMVTQQTKMVEKALGEMSAVMSGVAVLINAAHNAGITSRVPPLPPPPPVEIDDDEAAEAAEPEAPTSKLSEATRLIITETIDRVIPLIFAKFTASGVTSIGGIPVEALADWRKAAPAAAPSAPAAQPPAAHHASNSYAARSPVWNVPAASTPPTSAPAASVPASPVAGVDAPVATVTPPGIASVVAGAAPRPDSPLGAAPAETAQAPAGNSPQTHDEARAMINAHMLRVWAGLSPPERTRAGELIAQLAARDRTAWLAELARLTVPEAIARARAVIHAQQPHAPPTSPPPAPPLPSEPPEGAPP